jgi:hypothetical protein
MAVYRFRVTFEDYDEVIREVDVLSSHTFLELHKAIHTGTGYDPEAPSSFYVSNDQWKKGQEIAYLPDERKLERGVILMEETKLNKFIDDPHQKFYYTYQFSRPFDFHVQLIRILKEEAGKTYPLISKSIGQAPKLPGTLGLAGDLLNNSTDKKDANEFDALADTEYGIDEEEDLDLLNDDEDQSDDSDADSDMDMDFEEEI